MECRLTGEPCPFCTPEAVRVFHTGALTLGLWDGFPVNPGHALLIPKRHVATWFEATDEERSELVAAIAVARQEIERRHQPDGYNVGINIGRAAGQTVFHLHIHVIPRYAGDVSEPRGGVRHVVPAKADYLAQPERLLLADRSEEHVAYQGASLHTPHARALIAGGEDELLPHLLAHLDAAASADFAVAFVLESGVALIEEHLADLLNRGGRLRFITGDYLGVTEPHALVRLLDLKERYQAQAQLRVFEAGKGTFHLKSYVFHGGPSGGVALVGSSNLSRPALREGLEWNYRTVTSRDRQGYAEVLAGFEALFSHPCTKALDAPWVDRYRARRPQLRSVPDRRLAPTDESLPPPPVPHAIQARALAALEATRAEGNSAGLVVMATGLGKTWLAAFDSARPEFPRVLFVAHREEILRQAMETFRRIRPDAHLGLYTGQEKTPEAEVLFASIQTLGRGRHLERFAPDAFHYIVVDEFHHAFARTYQRLIAYFEPKFLLGLTATPERTDGGDLLSLCQENLVFRCDLPEGIREGLLSPFHYYGVPDEVDYRNIPWRSSRFDEEALTQAVATRSRAENALEQYRERAGKRTLAFCCSTRHADFMRKFFREAGLRVAAVHSEPSIDPRATSLERLEANELDVIFAVDMFNEGVDLPDVDTIMMLRPTESRILWLQQFGRGLRKATGKEHLRVIDYIGNHRTFLLKPQTLFNLSPGDEVIREVLNLVQRGEAELPPGCEVTYDLKAIEILRALLRRGSEADVVRFYYEDYRERHGVRPTASEMHHEGYSPRMLRKGYGSWLRFVKEMGDLPSAESATVEGGSTAEFLDSLETTEMTKSLKMLVLLATLDAERFPGEIEIDELAVGVRRIARRSAALQQDFSVSLDDDVAMRAYLERNPIEAWCGGKGTGGRSYFRYAKTRFSTTFNVDPERRDAFKALVRELAEWRLAEYLDRATVSDSEVRGDAVGRPSGSLELWRSYMREEIPPIVGRSFSRFWQQGYVHQAAQIFLFVTLDKSRMPKEHRYGDRFLARDLFEWKSQNQQAQNSKAGRTIRDHEREGIPVHLFVRKRGKVRSNAAPFIYCGELRFESWEGNNPITVHWRLKQPLSERIAALFEVG